MLFTDKHLVVADMTGRNPNVFYEVGYAHALGKPVVLITKRAEDIPFDLKHYPHIVYGGRITDLIPELRRRVKWVIDHPKEDVRLMPIQFYIDGQSLVNYPEILCKVKKTPVSFFEFKLDANNSIASEITKAEFQIGFITSDRFDYIFEHISISKTTGLEKFKQPDGRYLHLHRRKFEILPGAWESTRIELNTSDNKKLSENTFESIVLRLFSETGIADFPFKVGVIVI